MPIEGRRVTLRRRGAGDGAFVRACWADADFMRRFNRVARELPQDDAELAGILAREWAGTFAGSRALHWTLHVAAGPVGFISVTDYAPGHRRAEFLIGVLDRPPSAVPVEAAWLACDFLYRRAKVERLTAYFYAENVYAAKVAEKFGFRREGVLRGYIRDADGARSDLVVAGMLLDDQTASRTHRILGRR
jgi:RimJ/RimL family protein N-acetyltransferase